MVDNQLPFQPIPISWCLKRCVMIFHVANGPIQQKPHPSVQSMEFSFCLYNLNSVYITVMLSWAVSSIYKKPFWIGRIRVPCFCTQILLVSAGLRTSNSLTLVSLQSFLGYFGPSVGGLQFLHQGQSRWQTTPNLIIIIIVTILTAGQGWIRWKELEWKTTSRTEKRSPNDEVEHCVVNFKKKTVDHTV